MVSKITINPFSYFACLVLGTSLVMLSSGCAVFNMTNSSSQIPAVEKTNSRGMYQVEMSGGFAKSQAYQGELDGPLTVQDALQRSGAIERFRNMEIMVYRVVQDSGHGLKMPVLYDRHEKMVTQEQNYAIHPNDRIVVKAATNNALDKLVDSMKKGGG